MPPIMHPPLEPEGSSFIQIAATVLIVSTSHWLPPRNRITPEPVNTSMSPPLTSTFHEDPPTTINHRSLKQSFSAETAIPLFVVLFTIYQSVALLFDIFTYFTSRSKLAINPDSKVNDLAAGSKQFDLAAEEIRKYTAAHDAITKKLTSTDKELETKSKEFDAKVQECAAWKEAATWIYNFLIEQLHLKDEKLAKIQVDRDAARAGRSEAEHKNAKLEEDGEAARASLNKAESKITKLKEKRDAARAGRNEAESEIKKLEEGRDAACAGQNRAEAEAIKLAKERDAAQADLDNAKAEIIELRKERDAARSGHDEVQIQCGELKKEIEAANAGQIVAAAKASKLEHDLAAARAGQAHAEDVAAGLRKELTTSKTEAAEAKAKIGGLEKDRDAARAGQASAKAHVAKWKLSFREQGKSIRKLEKYSYKIRNRELSWKITLRELNEEKARLVQVNKEKFQKAEDDRHVALEKAKKEREAEIQDLRSQLCKQKDAANGEKQEVSDLRQELKKVKDESHVKGRRADTAERHLRDRDITIKRAKDHQEAILKKAHDEHNSDMQALDRKLQDAIMIAAYERKKRDATITDLESGLQARHEVAITASKEAKEARRQAKAAEAKLITLDDRVLSFQHELKDPETQTSSLKDALHRQEREQIALVKKHRGDERSWKEQMSSLEQDLKNQKEECKATDEMLAARHQELEQKNEKIKEQKAELIQTKPELDKKETKRIELEGQIVPLQHALKKSRSACSKLDEALQSNRDALTKLNALVAGMEVQPFAGHAKELDTIEKLKEENLLAANNIRILNLIRKKILQVAGENEASAELVFPRDLIDHIQAGLKEVLNMLDPKHTRRQVGDPQVADAIDEDIAQVKFFVQANLAMMQGAQGFIEQLKGAWIELTNVQKMLSCMEEQLFDDNKDTDDVLCYLDKNFQDQISTRVIAMMKRKVEDMAEENMTTWDDEKVIKKLQEKEHAKQELRQQVKGMQKQVTGLREELTRAVEKNNDQSRGILHNLSQYKIDEKYFASSTITPATGNSDHDGDWHPDMALDADLLIERDQASSRAAAFARLPPLETNTTGRARSAPPPQTRHQPVWLENGDIDVDDDEPDCIPDYALGPDGKPIKPFGSPKGAPKRSPEDEDRIRRHFGQSKHADGGESGAADGTGDGGDADGHGNDEGAEQGGDDAPAGDEGNGNDDDTTEARPEQGDEIPDSGNDDKGQGGGIGSGDDKKKDDGTSQTGGDIGSASGKPVPIKGIQASRWAV